ncbi:MAG: DUF2203 domain-containing protein, partial [Candidatus Eisenbacteria bacterium]|nr:DUF2203 domain-containing protein [Candidatus Eisenbacteria bacterium]
PFTLTEANRLIPYLEEQLRVFQELYLKLEEYRDRISVLRLVSASAGPDHEDLLNIEGKARGTARLLAELQKEILSTGCAPKSYRDGLVDFFTLRGDRLVFLCWKLGESEIEWWHSLEGGFQKRRPISELVPETE